MGYGPATRALSSFRMESKKQMILISSTKPLLELYLYRKIERQKDDATLTLIS